MSRPKLGLVVGKFAPLHLGHEALIDFALGRCDQLLILSYTSQRFAMCSAAQRELWLKMRYGHQPRVRFCVLDQTVLAGWPVKMTLPNDNASDFEQREFCWQILLQLGFIPDLIFTSESYGDGFAQHLAQAAQRDVRHWVFDPARAHYPISASQIRRAQLSAKDWLSPDVARMYRPMGRVALLGAESTGKSTLSRMLSAAFAVPYVAEFGRQLWEEKRGQLEFDDLLQIAQTQIAHEDAALAASRAGIICDTTPLTTLFYSQALFARAAPTLQALAEREYQTVFLLAPDFPLVQDGTRQDEAFRQAQHQWYLAELAQRNIAYQLIAGPIDLRLGLMADLLGISF